METITKQLTRNLMEPIYQSFKTAIRNSLAYPPKNWLQSHALTENESKAGYVSDRILESKGKEFKLQLEQLGMLKYREDGNCKIFGRGCIVFPLFDESGQINNLFSIHLKSGKQCYLNQQGIYPEYPHEETEKIYVVNSILEAATLLQSKTLKKREAVIALHDGEILPEHYRALKNLKELKEIIVLDTKV